jgi:hypothetical protein
LKSKLNKENSELRSRLDTYLNGLFQVIRIQRNEAGHPTGVATSREQVNGTIVAFIDQLGAIYQLIDFIKPVK